MGVSIFEGNKARRMTDALEVISQNIENLIAPDVAQETAVIAEAKRWVDGKDLAGNPVPSTAPQYENNAKYYAEQTEAAKTTAVQAIEDKGEQVLHSIPSDYTELSGDVADLKSAFGAISVPITYDPDSDGKYINANGSIGSSANFHYTDLLKAYAGLAFLSFAYSGTKMGVRVHGYNHNGIWVKQIYNIVEVTSDTAELFEIPDDVEFLRISISKGTTDVMLVCNLQDTVSKVDGKYEQLQKRMGRINLFNPNDSDVVRGQYISSLSSGSEVWTTHASFGETGFIPVTPGDRLTIFYAGNTAVSTLYHVWYDANKKPMAGNGSMPSNKYYTVPDGCAYYRTAYALSRKKDVMIIVLSDDDTIPYDPTGETYTPYGGLTLPYVIKNISSFDGTGGQWAGKTWYAYGTSITANNGTSGLATYVTYLKKMSGMTAVNKGLAGKGIGTWGWSGNHGEVYDAICNITDGKLNADLITLETGANDVISDTPLGTVYDTGRTTLAGCLNDCLRYLQANTNAQIAVINSPAGTTEPNATGQYYEWAKMVEEICHINRVHFLNNDTNMGWAKISDSTKGSLYVRDSIHQTNLGSYIMAQNMWYQLMNVPCFYTEILDEDE